MLNDNALGYDVLIGVAIKEREREEKCNILNEIREQLQIPMNCDDVILFETLLERRCCFSGKCWM